MYSTTIPILLAVLESGPGRFKHSITVKKVICLVHYMRLGIASLHKRKTTNRQNRTKEILYLSHFYYIEIQKYIFFTKTKLTSYPEVKVHRISRHLNANILLASVSI